MGVEERRGGEEWNIRVRGVRWVVAMRCDGIRALRRGWRARRRVMKEVDAGLGRRQSSDRGG